MSQKGNAPPDLQLEIGKVIDELATQFPSHPMHEAFSADPWKMLVAVVLSQRATDLATIRVASLLFQTAPTPADLLLMSQEELEGSLRPIGFFRQKARALRALASAVLDRHSGKVPLTEPELLNLPQVGRKTANIILTLYTDTPQLAVDIHVHRISNRLGWVQTKTPDQTEQSLTPLLTKDQIKIANHILVQHGQHTCRPVSPFCSSCPVAKWCKKVDVTNSR